MTRRFLALILAFCGAICLGSGTVRATEIQVPSVLVKLIEQVEVPARSAGVLDRLDAREGQMVDAGDVLGQIDDHAARFAQRKAELELAGATKLADSDVRVRFARKNAAVAEAELQRALDSAKRLSDSVSASELDQLKLLAEKAALEIEQAELEWDVARTATTLKQNDVDTAQHDVAQRVIQSPLAGFVAQRHRNVGEWVEPGQPIVRLLRLDRLRAEGLANAADVGDELMGRPVRLHIRQGNQSQEYSGTVVFVSPEVDPVSGQVRIWAEIENRDLQLRPGLHGAMTILDAVEQP